MASIEGYSLSLLSIENARSEIDLADLVGTYSTTLFRIAHSILRSSTEAEDVVQDTFVRVLQHRHTLPAVRDLRLWLIRITWNLAIDRRRRIQPEQFDDSFAESLVANSVPADQAFNEAQRMKSVLREMEKLPKGERDVLLLSAVEELETAEMAKILGRSESAVRALLFRARARLRERLERGGAV
jgi:RNA polymerase sigma-70 factor (ECF subfamily)